MIEVVDLGGKRFRSIPGPLTTQHDHYVKSRVIKAGLRKMKIGEGESPADFAERITAELMYLDMVHSLLGGLLIPYELDDEQWSPEVAAATAEYIRTMRDPAGIAKVQELTLTVVIPFFVHGLTSLYVSDSSSEEGSAEAAPK